MALDVRTSKEISGAAAPKALRVGFILSKSFTLSAFALFVDTLRLASDSEDRSRRVNCDSANAEKVVAAAQEQIDAIRRIVREYGIDALPEPLKDAALLRIANPEASLADLATLSYPPVTKSCLSHRLKKIMSFKPEE